MSDNGGQIAAAPPPAATQRISRKQRSGTLVFYTLREGVAIPAILLFLFVVWANNVAPPWQHGVWLYLDTLFRMGVVGWFLIANNYAVAESTKDKNLGDDNILPREQGYTNIMVFGLGSVFVLHCVLFGMRKAGMVEANWLTSAVNLNILDLVWWAALVLATWVDHQTNNKFVGRAQRLMPDTRYTQAGNN